VAYKNEIPVLVIERDGGNYEAQTGHYDPEQRKRDAKKEYICAKHGIRLWRWKNWVADLAFESMSRSLRRGIKGKLYASYGTLKTDCTKLCECTRKDGV
jgi:hypothetical protein